MGRGWAWAHEAERVTPQELESSALHCSAAYAGESPRLLTSEGRVNVSIFGEQDVGPSFLPRSIWYRVYREKLPLDGSAAPARAWTRLDGDWYSHHVGVRGAPMPC